MVVEKNGRGKKVSGSENFFAGCLLYMVTQKERFGLANQTDRR